MAGNNTNLLVLMGCMFLLVISTQISFSLGLDDGRVSESGFIAQVTDKFHAENLLHSCSKTLFEKFIVEHGKVYATVEEYVLRLRIFEKNLLKAAKNQALDPTAVHGITPFSDLTEFEFESRYTGLLSVPQGLVNDAPTADVLPVDDLPANFDWREKGAVTEVKTQGNCGSCWAFSTTGVIEGANFLATGKLLNLSEQQLIDCDHKCDPSNNKACDNGCHGGLMTNAYNYLMESGGIEEAKNYPYTGIPGDCKFNPDLAAVKVINFTTVPLDEKQIAAHLVKHGPLAVGLNAAFMQTYIGGVSCPLICSKRFINHGVLLVGYGHKGFALLRLGYRPYWIIKNSWGERWGEHGYYKLCRGHGECGMNKMVSAVIPER